MKNLLKEYFSFSRKERTGIIVLLLLILTTMALPHFLPDPPVHADKTALENLKRQLSQQAITADSIGGVGYHSRYNKRGDESAPRQGVLFEFDPNTLSPEGWKRLGIRERTALTIQRYLAKGGRFRQPDDLHKIYGLRKEEADRLVPYVRISGVQEASNSRPAGFTPDSPPAWKYKGDNVSKRVVIDINLADTTAFIALRGIGSKLAKRIIHFREKLGGFHSVEQVGETYGLPDSTFQQIRKWLLCAAPDLRTINVNTADADLLQQHPYISWPEANAIVQYRLQHGAYASLDQLLQINIISPVLLDKIKPYLAVK
ncbi:MAG: helix-hairpin-helix domain-containing protein [Niastella sp.]|nr:helix-hairpin-helix domain-containing protein [Niastella sp.]